MSNVIDEPTIRSILEDMKVSERTIGLEGGSIPYRLLVEGLIDGINTVLATAQQAALIRAELEGLKEQYEDNCAELDAELYCLRDACKHPSAHEHPDLERVFVCNICGSTIDEDNDDER